MTAVAANTIGGLVKTGAMKVSHAELLAKALFDGKRELTVGGHTIITPGLTDMTKHEQMILTGLFLKAQVKP